MKIGVYTCHCGSNIAGTVDCEAVAKWAGELEHVEISRDYKFMCSSLGQELIEDDIQEYGLDRVVVASCSPHMHEPTFRSACQRAGLNPYFFEMANIREHASWVHKDRADATEKAKALVGAAVEPGAVSRAALSPSAPRSTRTRWSSAAGWPASRPRWKSPTPAITSTWSSGSRASAGTWPNWTRPSRPSTAPPAS